MSDKLTRCNEWMFQKVRCSRYLKKVKDGRFISVDKDGNAEYVDTSREVDGDVWHEPIEEDDYDGSEKFLKTYYEYKKKEFVGVAVGLKMLNEDKRCNDLTGKEWLQNSFSIWREIKTKEEKDLKHPASYPVALCEKLIRTFSRKGSRVLDPFSGIGSTMV